MATTRTYVKIIGPPIHTQDDDGIWTTTISYSDSTSTVIVGGYNTPSDRFLIQIAVDNVLVAKNQAALIDVGLLPVTAEITPTTVG